MDEVKKKGVAVDGHKLVMTLIFVAATAVVFLGIGYVAGKNSAGTSEVAVVSEPKTEKTTTAIETSTATTNPLSVKSSAAANEFCQLHTTGDSTVKKMNYQEVDGSFFVDCSIGNDIAGSHTIGKVIDGVWTKIWQGNGDMSCDVVNQYDIPSTISAHECV